jgi:hypothetical protein
MKGRRQGEAERAEGMLLAATVRRIPSHDVTAYIEWETRRWLPLRGTHIAL